MKILGITETPIHRIPFHNVDGKRKITKELLPVLQGTITGLPPDMDGLIAMSDLQGRECTNRTKGRLLGELVAEQLIALHEKGKLPHPSKLGVLLAGDFYAMPELERRGGLGDVSPVWQALSKHFRWVAGVLGNHDRLDLQQMNGTKPPSKLHLLDGTVAQLDGLRIGGISGIMGDPSTINCKSEVEYFELLESIRLEKPDLLILHEGPSGQNQTRNHRLRDYFEEWAKSSAESDQPTPLIICGHKHWPTPLMELSNDLQVLNVDSRVVVLLRN